MRRRWEEANRLRDAGLSYRKIAEAMGVPKSTVTNWLAHPEDQERYEEFLEWRRQGLNNREIAERAGISRQRVADVLGPHVREKSSGESRTIDARQHTWERVREVALGLGLTPKTWPRSYQSLTTMLLDGIATGEIEVRWAEGCGPDQPLPDPDAAEQEAA